MNVLLNLKQSNQVSNAAAVPVGFSLFGGEASQIYNYDNLYQLTSAKGLWTAREGHQYCYNLEMGYDTIGNIKSKTQFHEKLPYEGDKWIEEQKTTYTGPMAYSKTAACSDQDR